MPKQSWLTNLALLLVLVLLVAIFGAIAYTATLKALDVFEKALVAVAGLGTSIVLAFFNSILDRQKERQQREFLTKQENYKELLQKIGSYARGTQGAADALATVHLGSLAFGDSDVILATNKFMVFKDQDSLIELLKTIRRAIGLPDFDSSPVTGFDARVLFPRETAPIAGLR